MVLAVQKGLNVSCLIEKATTILGNSAGGVTRQRHCQPNLPPTPDQNTWAPGAAMASLWATTLFFCFFLNPIITYSYTSEQFFAQAGVSPLCVRKNFIGSFQPWLNFAREKKNTSARHAEPDSPSCCTEEHSPSQRSSARLSACLFPLPSFSVGCAWCSATLEK